MVISELVRNAAASLTENPQFEAELMVMNTLGISRTQLVTDIRREVNEQEINQVNGMVKRRLLGEPLQYIMGECEFMSLDFYVKSGVLIPRIDTETLVEYLIDEIGSNRTEILDICAGSGCIGISIAHYRKGIYANLADVSDIALETARENIERHNLSERVRAVKMDILKECPDKKYDIVVSNPPYIETDVIDTLQIEVKDYEPRLALDGGYDGLVFYRRITKIAPLILKKDGILAFEIGYNQGSAVKKLMGENFDGVRVIKDFCGNDRVVTGRLK